MVVDARGALPEVVDAPSWPSRPLLCDELDAGIPEGPLRLHI